ncbi:e3 ubiquitin-protein transferase maea [Anaeramoeba flamelloides]|uniref:E3 ubiquitin-protein transferase maea n=1 Tax=Anaeramoeba flamelloides TaxID=1746091 RepID=A0ABQ8YVF1_9EUKA|nr:e3 ubiquitin-protein transferase maea [Anaeramoeba flamelloides]
MELNRKLTEYMFRKKVSVLLSKHDLSIPLKWCLINRSKLKKIDSRFEFELKKQQFIEIMRKGNRKQAINYTRKNFPQWVGKCFPEIKRVMGLLAIPTPDEQSPLTIEEKEAFEMLPRRYQLLYGEQSWKMLNEAFNREHVILFCLSKSPSIEVEFKSGICALKIASCQSNHKLN